MFVKTSTALIRVFPNQQAITMAKSCAFISSLSLGTNVGCIRSIFAHVGFLNFLPLGLNLDLANCSTMPFFLGVKKKKTSSFSAFSNNLFHSFHNSSHTQQSTERRTLFDHSFSLLTTYSIKKAKINIVVYTGTDNRTK